MNNAALRTPLPRPASRPKPSYTPLEPALKVQLPGACIRWLFETWPTWSSAVLRITLGIVMGAHGAQKVFGWFGGQGFEATMQDFTAQMHIPAPLAVLAILAESLASVALLAGLLTRVAAFGITCNMLVAMLLVHRSRGFFMNWFGQQTGEGCEYHLLAIGLGVALMIGGWGKWSVDRVIACRLSKT